jgi:hypothetical protein
MFFVLSQPPFFWSGRKKMAHPFHRRKKIDKKWRFRFTKNGDENIKKHFLKINEMFYG